MFGGIPGCYVGELTAMEVNELNGLHAYAVDRYSHYRNRGLDQASALSSAYAWARNSQSQRDRRLAHGTGAV